MWRHAFPKRGRTISFNIESEVDSDDRATYLESINQYYLDVGETDSLIQFTDDKSNGYEIEGNISYTEPIGAKGQLQVNYVLLFPITALTNGLFNTMLQKMNIRFLMKHFPIN